MITLYPVEIEAYDDMTKESMFKVKAVDEFCAEVTISTIVTEESWDEIAKAVKDALVLMKMTSDGNEVKP